MHDLVGETNDVEQFLFADGEGFLLAFLFPELGYVFGSDLPDVVGVEVKDVLKLFFFVLTHKKAFRGVAFSVKELAGAKLI